MAYHRIYDMDGAWRPATCWDNTGGDPLPAPEGDDVKINLIGRLKAFVRMARVLLAERRR